MCIRDRKEGKPLINSSIGPKRQSLVTVTKLIYGNNNNDTYRELWKNDHQLAYHQSNHLWSRIDISRSQIVHHVGISLSWQLPRDLQHSRYKRVSGGQNYFFNEIWQLKYLIGKGFKIPFPPISRFCALNIFWFILNWTSFWWDQLININLN